MDPFHEGEHRAQQLAGESEMAARLGAMIHDRIAEPARAFLAQRPMVIVASEADDGSLWASPLFGEAGLVRSSDGREVVFDLGRVARTAGDPFWSQVRVDADVGILAIDPSARRRLRVNVRITSVGDAEIRAQVREAYPNCPKYIQRRRHRPAPIDPGRDARVFAGRGLDAERRALVERADTFFVASAHSGRGADASHRGGPPGFVEVVGDATLRVPDYPGNGMFNTLGNMLAQARAGATFVDFDRGRLLSLTGTARVLFDRDDPRGETAGTRRFWELEVERWVDAPAPVSWRWELIDPSPHNPEPR